MTPGLVEALCDAVTSDSPDQRERLYSLLAAVPDGSVGELVREATGCLEGAQLGRLIVCLGSLGRKEAVEPLTSLLQHSSPDVRAMSAYALMRLADPHGLRGLVDSLSDESANVVLMSLQAIVSIADSCIYRPLVSLLDHPSWDVQLAACRALVQLRFRVPQVVTTLESLSVKPEAAAYDESIEYIQKLEAIYNIPEGQMRAEKLHDIIREAKALIC